MCSMCSKFKTIAIWVLLNFELFLHLLLFTFICSGCSHKEMFRQKWILNVEKLILVEGWFSKPINRRHALGGGWGGGGPNPPLPSNVVPHTTTYITQNRDLPNQTKPPCPKLSWKFSWKTRKLEVRRAFCNNGKVCRSKSLEKSCKRKPLRK